MSNNLQTSKDYRELDEALRELEQIINDGYTMECGGVMERLIPVDKLARWRSKWDR